MVVNQARPKRTVGGARYHAFRKKRLSDMGSEPTLTKIGKRGVHVARGRAGILKVKLMVSETANVLNPQTKKYSQSKILTVVDNAASRHFIRRNIITKGAVINTEAGKAKVTSRPGQDGTINAILIE